MNRRKDIADMIRDLRMVDTPNLTPKERNQAIRAHAYGWNRRRAPDSRTFGPDPEPRETWTPGHKPSGLGRWQGTDCRLAKALDDAMADGCCDECGDVDGPGYFARVPFSHRPGGYIVEVTTYGFHDAIRYDDAAEFDAAWKRLETLCAEFYDDETDDDADVADDD